MCLGYSLDRGNLTSGRECGQTDNRLMQRSVGRPRAGLPAGRCREYGGQPSGRWAHKSSPPGPSSLGACRRLQVHWLQQQLRKECS